MRLKKLELFGFKSFADKTEVIFDKGVTCVVGPNGCGKSNISDSIRWVLGERSAKMLRGSKMEDVIFNGTDFRKAIAMAEVSLTIDNSDRGLAIDYNEVTITRRLYRSGESEYLINKTLVRLKDIQDLILDTGIGSSSYSMIEQGRIDYILNADAEERRFLIEEAAGISKFKVKKEEAIRKLERTEQNLLRLNDIVQEVHRNIQYAERQAKRAERFKEQYEKLKALEIRKSFFDLGNIIKEKEGIESRQTADQDEITRIETGKTETRQMLSRQEEDLRHLLQNYSAEESERYELRSKTEKNDQQLKFNQEKRIQLATRRGEIQQEERQLSERLLRTEKDIALKKNELAELEISKTNLTEDLRFAEENLKRVDAELLGIKADLEKRKAEAFEIAAEITRVKNEYHRLLAFLESCDKQKTKMDGSLERFANERESWESKKKEYETQIAVLSERYASLEQDEKRIEETLQGMRLRLEQEKRESENTQRLINESGIRLEMLRKLDADYGVDKDTVLKDVPDIEGHLIRGIRDVVRVKNGYEGALEAVLGIFSQCWVADNYEVAIKLFPYFSEHRANGLGLLVQHGDPNEEITPDLEKPEHPLIRCSLRDVMEIKKGYENLLDPLFHDVYIVQKFDATDLADLADIAQDYLLVTQDGICFGLGGYLHFRPEQGIEQSFFKRGAEIETLRQKEEDLYQTLHLQAQAEEQLTKKIRDMESQCESLQSAEVDCKIQKESFESFRNSLEERLLSQNREVQMVAQDIEELKHQQIEVTERKAKVEAELNAMTIRETEQREAEDRLRSNIELKDAEKSKIVKDLAEYHARFQHLQEQERILRETLNIFSENYLQDQERLAGLGEEYVRIEEREKGLDLDDEKLQGEQVELGELLKKAEVVLEMMRRERERYENEIEITQASMQKLTDRQQTLQEALHQAQMSIMDLNYREKSILERMEQTYHLKLTDLNPLDYPWGELNPQEVEAELEKLREKVQALGTVNLLAIDEYDELKQRYDFLMAQKTDMENAREELLEAIRKINRTTKSLFDETFANVQKYFLEYYQTLFRGGEAKLILIDEVHPLESGVDIVVRPPGKKLQHITLLSGGEKALTAIALLFALFKIKPSPFCVLDEIDAPLDEANIDRFLTVLRTFLESSQFIIVTHNRKTIAMGDSLYGVTMQEPGISKIVSVKIHASDEDESSEPKDAVEVKEETIEDSIVA